MVSSRWVAGLSTGRRPVSARVTMKSAVQARGREREPQWIRPPPHQFPVPTHPGSQSSGLAQPQQTQQGKYSHKRQQPAQNFNPPGSQRINQPFIPGGWRRGWFACGFYRGVYKNTRNYGVASRGWRRGRPRSKGLKAGTFAKSYDAFGPRP